LVSGRDAETADLAELSGLKQAITRIDKNHDVNKISSATIAKKRWAGSKLLAVGIDAELTNKRASPASSVG